VNPWKGRLNREFTKRSLHTTQSIYTFTSAYILHVTAAGNKLIVGRQYYSLILLLATSHVMKNTTSTISMLQSLLHNL